MDGKAAMTDLPMITTLKLINMGKIGHVNNPLRIWQQVCTNYQQMHVA